MHAALPLIELQARPHPPQLDGLTAVLTSQPVEYAPSQLAYGVLQLPTRHVPPAQVAVPFWTEQAVAQSPQASTLFVVAVSQPSAGFALQSPNPVEHEIEQVP